jgi:hypothetical protein
LLIRDFSGANSARRLERLELGGQLSGYNEAWLQNLLARRPQALPIDEIEPAMAGAVPACLELPTAAGNADLVLVSPQGDLVVIECKLWRNPLARRQVVGQIIDYAKELPRGLSGLIMRNVWFFDLREITRCPAVVRGHDRVAQKVAKQ